MIKANFTGEMEGEPKQAFAITAKWHKDILPKLKKVFKGRLMAKLDKCPSEMDVLGYDYIGITVNHKQSKITTFEEDVKRRYQEVSQAATLSQCKWLVAEAWMPYGGRNHPETKNQEEKSLDELQDNYFKITTDEYLSFRGSEPSGFVFISWLMEGMEIRDRPAEKVIREFFKQI